MAHKPFLFVLLILSVIIGVFQTVAVERALYLDFLWLDMLMHLLGGVWVAAVTFAFYLWGRGGFMPPRLTLFLVILLSVLSISLGWEVIELLFDDMSLARPLYWPDTLSDFIFATVGGFIGYGVLTWRYQIPAWA